MRGKTDTLEGRQDRSVQKARGPRNREIGLTGDKKLGGGREKRRVEEGPGGRGSRPKGRGQGAPRRK